MCREWERVRVGFGRHLAHTFIYARLEYITVEELLTSGTYLKLLGVRSVVVAT